MPSEESRRIIAELRTWPASDGLPLAEWRFRAGALERLPWPPGLRSEPVDVGVPAQFVCLEPGRAGGDLTADSDPVGLLFHGGGFIVCSAGTHRLLGARLGAVSGGRMLVVDYRRAPEYPFPSAVRDCSAAYRWVLDQGVDPARVWFFGDSAGGNLCLIATAMAVAQGLPAPAALVLASPLTDMSFSGESYRTKSELDPFARIDSPSRMSSYYLAGADPTDPLASPLFADLTGLPPLLTLLGPDEVLLDDAVRLHERALAAGVDSTMEIVDGAFHTWLGYGGTLPEADASIARIGGWIRERLRAAG